MPSFRLFILGRLTLELELSNSLALVVGGASGIGKACVDAMLKEVGLDGKDLDGLANGLADGEPN